MAHVRIVTDSTADIPPHLVEACQIAVVPLKVHVGEQTYLDGVTLQAADFYQKLRQGSAFPTTSQPSPHELVAIFREAVQQGAKEILSIHVSSALSGTYQSAVLAKSMVEEEFADVKVTVYDSKTVTFALGMVVVLVARAAQAGKSLQELLVYAQKVRDTEMLVAVVDTLEYLQKGGRIGKASALVGSLLNIKPIISIHEEGEVYVMDKVRGKSRAFQQCFALLEQKIAPGSTVIASVLHADRSEEASEWLQQLQKRYHLQEGWITALGPVVGAHAGPGTIGCVVVPVFDK
jgi:DegV family protein with EDD domain